MTVKRLKLRYSFSTLIFYSEIRFENLILAHDAKSRLRGSGTDLLEFFIFKSCGLSGGRKLVFWKVSWQGSRVSPLDHQQSITQTLTSTKGLS